MNNFVAQLPALLGVLVGVFATVLADRIRWRRSLSIRWDARRLGAYVNYAAAIKEIHALLFRLTAVHRPGSLAHPIDRNVGLAMLAKADGLRTKAWEKVLMLGDEATVSAAREWRDAVRQLELFALGTRDDWDQWNPAVRRVDEARDRFYAAAGRVSMLAVGASRSRHGSEAG